jgi:predicted dehydrogenase
MRIHEEDAMTIRIAAIEVSHWHALHDAAYLRHLIAMPDVELVAIQDSDVGLVARRAAEVGSPPTFTDYRQMLAITRPDFVVALGRHRQMAEIAHDLLDQGYPFLMEKPMGINASEVEGVAAKAAQLHAFVAVPLAQRYTPFATRARELLALGALARCRTSMSGSTGRDRRAIKPGIALGCSIPPRLVVAASATWVRTG